MLKPSSLLNSAMGALGLVAVWQLFSYSGLVSQIFLPSPARAVNALVFGFTDGELLDQTQATIMRMAEGWLLSSLAGIAIGSLVGISPTARAYLAPSLEFLRPLPASAVIPVAIALFGLTPGMVTGAVVFGSLWPTLLATIHGFANIDPGLREVARALGLSQLQFVFKIGLPNASPDILGGMRLSLTVALILTIVGEMITGQVGLGSAILLAGRSFQSPDLYAGLILLGGIGVATNAALQRTERYLLRWR